LAGFCHQSIALFEGATFFPAGFLFRPLRGRALAETTEDPPQYVGRAGQLERVSGRGIAQTEVVEQQSKVVRVLAAEAFGDGEVPGRGRQPDIADAAQPDGSLPLHPDGLVNSEFSALFHDYIDFELPGVECPWGHF
jgi:hypothetical protein